MEKLTEKDKQEWHEEILSCLGDSKHSDIEMLIGVLRKHIVACEKKEEEKKRSIKYYHRKIDSLSKMRKVISSNLIRLRKEKGLTVGEASVKLKIKAKSLALMEQGYGIKSVNLLYAVSEGYDVELIDF